MNMAVNLNIGAALPDLPAAAPADATAATGEFAALLSGATTAPGVPGVPAAPAEQVVSALHIQLAKLTIASVPGKAAAPAADGEAAAEETMPAALPIDLAALTTRLGDLQKLMKRATGHKQPRPGLPEEAPKEGAALPDADPDKLPTAKPVETVNVVLASTDGSAPTVAPATAAPPATAAVAAMAAEQGTAAAPAVQPVTVEGSKIDVSAPIVQAHAATLPSPTAAVPLPAPTGPAPAAVEAVLVQSSAKPGESRPETMDGSGPLPLPLASAKADETVAPGLRAAVERLMRADKAEKPDKPDRAGARSEAVVPVPTPAAWVSKAPSVPAAKTSKPQAEADVAVPFVPAAVPSPALFAATASLQPQPASLAPLQDAAAIDAPHAAELPEMAIEHQLDMAHEGEWLDRLAKDIAQGSGNDGPLRFRLNPETLGTLKVEVQQSHAGTTVRFTADTEAARAMIADAQPRLLAEARAQGVRIAEAHVGTNPGGEQRRQEDSQQQQAFVRTARLAEVEAEQPEGADAAAGERFA